MKRDKRGRFAPDIPEIWEIDCALAIDITSGKNDPVEVARINATAVSIRERRAHVGKAA